MTVRPAARRAPAVGRVALRRHSVSDRVCRKVRHQIAIGRQREAVAGRTALHRSILRPIGEAVTAVGRRRHRQRSPGDERPAARHAPAIGGIGQNGCRLRRFRDGVLCQVGGRALIMIGIISHHLEIIRGARLQAGQRRGRVGSHVHLVVEMNPVGAVVNNVTGGVGVGTGVPGERNTLGLQRLCVRTKNHQKCQSRGQGPPQPGSRAA